MTPRQAGRVAGAVGAIAVCLAVAATSLFASQAAPPPKAASGHSDELVLQALDYAYNLDHDEAVKVLNRAVAEYPDDPAVHRAFATVLWLNILFRRGAVTVDHYSGSLTRSNIDVPRPDPELDRQFRIHIDRAIALAEQRVAARPRDPQAHYDLGAAVGLQASYMATIEGRQLAGFRAARRCFDEHQQTLALDGSRSDAKLMVGTYRYVVSTLSLPMRMVAYVAGLGGDRQLGIEALEAAAASKSDARTEAMFALVLVYNREHRYDDAIKIIRQLRAAYPRNRLIVFELGATYLRAGRGQQGDDALTEGLAMLAGDRRPRMPGEESLWRLKRGSARALLGRSDAAASDLRSSAEGDAQAWVKGRAHVELGRLALKRADRNSAINEARAAETLCTNGHDPACVEDARALARMAR